MSSDQVKNEIRRFLKSDDKLALCLRGKWGVGKTYTWDALLAEAFGNDTVSPQKYAYVSLFGLETLSDVRKSVFEHTVGAASFRETKDLEATFSSISERVAQLASKWRAGIGIIRGVPVVADYGGLVEAGFLDVRDQIVCFDDLERMSDGLDLKDVLGLISFLKEKKRCKVVLLLNSDALKEQDADDFRVQLEKVIDINLEYDPTSAEAIEIAIPNRSTLRSRLVAEYATTLGITNLRTVFKSLRICERLEEVLKGYDERVISQAFHSACLFAFALYQPNDAPPLETILKNRPYSDLFGNKEEKTPEQIQHAELLRRYRFLKVDGLDLVVFNSIRTGVYADELIKREADLIAAQLDLNDKDAAFTKAWDIYHDSFDDNGEEFAQALKQSIAENAVAISPSNLSASIATLKQLGHGEGTNDIIAAYIGSRGEGKEFWVGDPILPRFNVEDPDVKAAFASKAAEFADNRTLEEVATSIVRQSGWDNSDLDYLDQKTAEDFYKAIKEAKGEQLRLLVYGLTYFRNVGNPDPRMSSITTKAIEALQRLGRESEINRLRVSKFGVEVPAA
ncbi:hypothetical protein J2X65_002563 [Ancylobacter sp. 3268]|uniref:hypothetical protein n=1 Tax=Ancylobacter sp. 3268 TaxID=2817752 RepID=UPI0028655442|nr:hypothetical protein [Ancylobacter sp. 3268]MDR6953202.1 hypothetical protein [Ancylobacter sp. 3268]